PSRQSPAAASTVPHIPSRLYPRAEALAIMGETGQKVAIVTGGSQGIGAGLVEGYRQRGWGVVANSLNIPPSQDPDVLTVKGDISRQATADEIISRATDRFGRVDTL